MIMKHSAILFALIASTTIVLGQIDTTDFQQTDAEWPGFGYFNLKTKKCPKRIRKQMEDVLLIDGGSFTRTNPTHYHLLEKDSSVVSDYSDLIEQLCPPKYFNYLDMDSAVVSDSSDSIEQLYRTKLYFPRWFSNTGLSVASFLLSDHEVTNKEYREFVDWVTASVARKILAEKYPEKYLMKSNTSPTDKVFRPNVSIDWQDDYLRSILFSDTNRCGEKIINKSEIRYSGEIQVNQLDTLIHFDSLAVYPQTDDISYYMGLDQYSSCRNYFEDSNWDDYPVVGVSWEQAMAYCSWKTNRVNESILLWQKIINHPFYRDDTLWTESVDWTKLEENVRIPSYRLPTKAEWEYAALAIDNDTNPIRGWDNKISSRDRINLTDQEGSYLYNFGEIFDENGVVIKDFNSDGATFSNKVKSYPSNVLGLHDMRGNVSEWVLDGFNEDELCIKDLESIMDFDDRVDKIFTYMRENFELDHRTDKGLFYAQKYAKASMRFTQNFENKENLKLVTGGSWADGPMYLDPELDNAYPAQTQSMKIGFRIAQDFIGSPGIGGGKRKNYR